MKIPLSDRVAAGTVVQLTDAERAEFPVGTVVTRSGGILTASVPVTKPGERDRVAHVIGSKYDTVFGLAGRVREHFPPPSEDPAP